MARGRKLGSVSTSRTISAHQLRPVLKRFRKILEQQGLRATYLQPAELRLLNDHLIGQMSRQLEELLDWGKVQAWLAEVTRSYGM